MDFLNKLRSQPKHVRKMILWVIVIIVALALAIWWIHGSYWKIKKFPKEEVIKELNIPKWQTIPEKME